MLLTRNKRLASQHTSYLSSLTYSVRTSKPHVIDNREDMERVLTVQTDREISSTCINLHTQTDVLALTERQKHNIKATARIPSGGRKNRYACPAIDTGANIIT